MTQRPFILTNKAHFGQHFPAYTMLAFLGKFQTFKFDFPRIKVFPQVIIYLLTPDGLNNIWNNHYNLRNGSIVDYSSIFGVGDLVQLLGRKLNPTLCCLER